MKFIIDRFEDNFAVCEDENGNMINIDRKKISNKAKECDVIFLKDNKYFIDYEETKKLKEEIKVLTEDLWE